VILPFALNYTFFAAFAGATSIANMRPTRDKARIEFFFISFNPHQKLFADFTAIKGNIIGYLKDTYHWLERFV